VAELPPPGRGRAEPFRPRYARVAAFLGATLVTAVAILAGIGILPSSSSPATAVGRAGSGATADTELSPPAAQGEDPPDNGPTSTGPSSTAHPLPAGSGTGRRIVFDESEQRVWLVDASARVRRTYLGSGSVTGNLPPGTYSVYSRSRWAVGVDESGVMQYMVRFYSGGRAPIGFHSIPTKDGVPLQSRAQLGTPQSHGCIRQALPDAVALWKFAPVGTKVVVTA
jgi:hypothetical protein